MIQIECEPKREWFLNEKQYLLVNDYIKWVETGDMKGYSDWVMAMSDDDAIELKKSLQIRREQKQKARQA